MAEQKRVESEIQRDMRAKWSKPERYRLSAGDAENGTTGTGMDGPGGVYS